MANIETTLKWMEDRIGNVTYSMANRNGTTSYDCSSAVYYALWAGGFTTRINYAGNTENLFKEKGYLTTEISYKDIRRGDLFVSGIEGNSTGAAGHTGFVWDKNHIIHCNYTSNGIAITPINGRTGSPVRWYRIKGANPTEPTSKWDIDNYTDEEIARMIYDRDWILDGEERRQVLGSRYVNVQAIINAIAKGTYNPDRGAALEYNGATLTQEVLDKILLLAKQHDILPSYALTILHYEGLWGSSNVARLDNNWGGMTYNGKPRPSGIVVTKGSARPGAEGGNYMHYATVNDFLIDWFYLLRKGGLYKVSGAKTFEEAVKGMFIVGGASADYAALGYTKYLANAQARKKAIEKVNGSLSKYDPVEVVPHWESNSIGWWYVKGNRYLTNEWELINGIWYYFKEDGYMAQNEVIALHGIQYYFDNSGALKTETRLY